MAWSYWWREGCATAKLPTKGCCSCVINRAAPARSHMWSSSAAASRTCPTLDSERQLLKSTLNHYYSYPFGGGGSTKSIKVDHGSRGCPFVGFLQAQLQLEWYREPSHASNHKIHTVPPEVAPAMRARAVGWRHTAPRHPRFEYCPRPVIEQSKALPPSRFCLFVSFGAKTHKAH
jgi:hypothetical protein